MAIRNGWQESWLPPGGQRGENSYLVLAVDDGATKEAPGEGERTLEWWKEHLWNYYAQECLQLGRQATEEMPLICERFRVV